MGICFFSMIVVSASWNVVGPVSYVSAVEEEDDNEDEEEYEKEDEEDEEDGGQSTTTEVTTEKIIISETVSKEVVTTTHKDTDGDGVFDEQDQYPNINDHFIVKDENKNGIVDTYEK